MKTSVKKRVALGGSLIASIGVVAIIVVGMTSVCTAQARQAPAAASPAAPLPSAPALPPRLPARSRRHDAQATRPRAPRWQQARQRCRPISKYSGAPALLADDVTTTNGSTALYDGTATGLKLYLNDANSTYLTSTAPTSGTTFKTATGTATSLPATGIQDLLVSATAAAANTAVGFTLDYALPIASGNIYQGGSATVTLTFHAVLAGTNSLPSACTSAGSQCLAGSGFAWS